MIASNPAILSRGQIREDGFLFWSYEKRNEKFREKMVEPGFLSKSEKKTRVLSKIWKKKNRGRA